MQTFQAISTAFTCLGPSSTRSRYHHEVRSHGRSGSYRSDDKPPEKTSDEDPRLTPSAHRHPSTACFWGSKPLDHMNTQLKPVKRDYKRRVLFQKMIPKPVPLFWSTGDQNNLLEASQIDENPRYAVVRDGLIIEDLQWPSDRSLSLMSFASVASPDCYTNKLCHGMPLCRQNWQVLKKWVSF